jgi:hypothetical protein
VRQSGGGVYAEAEFSEARGDHWRWTVTGTVVAGQEDDFLGQYHRNSHMTAGNITDAVGSLELGKEVVATVLSERVEKGWMTEELAFEIARRIFHDNAIELFGLSK